MAAAAGKKQTRVEKERTRTYLARQEFHDGLIARRRRDNLIAGAAGGLLILAVVGGQIAYYTMGPGAPLPMPTDSSTPAPTPIELPGSSEIPAPTPTP
ncbi:dioxygenase [Microbacterium sp. VKM Ac-2870]|uniref:dioxygenase n=1 Tax=Microbacterium sp. VKM Ac-2870 TaxID=2783825 RepID=UPI001E563B05|nr:dioxygenase [Microbacterium sp. VKM Ac-2870]